MKPKSHSFIYSSLAVLFSLCSSSLLSARLKAFKMSLDQVELVSKLLRASRNCNELLLKDCFKEILEHGISPKELNSTDKSGRVRFGFRLLIFMPFFINSALRD
jgi:hypothetical protein